MNFTDNDIRHINDAASGKLLEVIKDFHSEIKKSGTTYTCKCSGCGAEKLSFNPVKEVFKCWNCNNVKGKGAISYLMAAEGMDYTAALDYLARKFNVILDEKPKPKAAPKTMKNKSKQAAGEDTSSYCARMLQASGLTYEDVTAKIFKADDNHTVTETKTFRPGTIDARGNIVEGDDAIIEYYDLNGAPVTYLRKVGRGTESMVAEYYRVRWQFPDEHLDKEGKPFKYKSPHGSGTPIYIPQRIREAYRKKTPIHRLYIQEGEKKAEKACKHGIPSIGISGIQNLGQKGQLPEDLVRIVEACQVKEVALIFDSDWQDLSHHLKITASVTTRPMCFYCAAKSFHDYMRMMKNRGIVVEVFIGHVLPNQAGDKGVDDLLVNTLVGREDELAKDFEFASNEKSGTGKYVQLYKISGWTDNKLKELWDLQSHEKFAERHFKVLSQLPEWKFYNSSWKFDEDGRLVNANPYDESEKFWSESKQVDRSGNEKTVFEYNYVGAKNFFQNRGFGRYKLVDGLQWIYIHMEPPVVMKSDVCDARDFIFSFAEQNCSQLVNNKLLQGGAQYIGDFQLQRLAYIQPSFLQPSRDEQYFYFSEKVWHITRDTVKESGYESISHHIWADQRKQIAARYLGKPLISFFKEGDDYTYSLSEEGAKCHFLQFLINTSNFTWRKKEEEIDNEELLENNQHLLSKLCAIGYMMMEAKDSNVTRAVIGMDGKQSEVGDSNGRSGKSLVGELMRQVMTIAYLPGKKPDLLSDAFVWNDIEENTRLVFIDDVLRNFNFEFLFPNITGDWTVNKKGGIRITYPFAKSPKIYIATNHAIGGTGSSFTDRQWLIAFSDFYNDVHKPVDDFGTLFFSEWDYEQWNLCWNMLACCVQLYLRYGVVQAPGDRLLLRKLRQEIGEQMISWADEYFSSEEHIGHCLVRKEVFDAFMNYDPGMRKFITPTAFKDRIKKYCEWKGFVFNPQKYDPETGEPLYHDKDGRPVIDDKRNGVEYFTIGHRKGEDVVQPAVDGVPLPPPPPSEEGKLDF